MPEPVFKYNESKFGINYFALFAKYLAYFADISMKHNVKEANLISKFAPYSSSRA